MSTAAVERREHQRLHTIGAVCTRLQPEFPDISISKIRYLEEQGLLTPKRTRGGYRLFSEEDVERLETILRLQRDEFLPLRVIRQELSSRSAKDRRRRRPGSLADPEEELDGAALAEQAGVPATLVRELEEFGLLAPRADGGGKRYCETDVEIARTCAELSRFGIAPRHLRAFRTSADRLASLLETIVAPTLRARSPERRQAGLEDLEALAEHAQELSQLLLWRELRNHAAPSR